MGTLSAAVLNYLVVSKGKGSQDIRPLLAAVIVAVSDDTGSESAIPEIPVGCGFVVCIRCTQLRRVPRVFLLGFSKVKLNKRN